MANCLCAECLELKAQRILRKAKDSAERKKRLEMEVAKKKAALEQAQSRDGNNNANGGVNSMPKSSGVIFHSSSDSNVLIKSTNSSKGNSSTSKRRRQSILATSALTPFAEAGCEEEEDAAESHQQDCCHDEYADYKPMYANTGRRHSLSAMRQDNNGGLSDETIRAMSSKISSEAPSKMATRIKSYSVPSASDSSSNQLQRSMQSKKLTAQQQTETSIQSTYLMLPDDYKPAAVVVNSSSSSPSPTANSTNCQPLAAKAPSPTMAILKNDTGTIMIERKKMLLSESMKNVLIANESKQANTTNNKSQKSQYAIDDSIDKDDDIAIIKRSIAAVNDDAKRQSQQVQDNSRRASFPSTAVSSSDQQSRGLKYSNGGAGVAMSLKKDTASPILPPLPSFWGTPSRGGSGRHRS